MKSNKLNKTAATATFLTLLLLSSFAQAERYLVALKNRDTYLQLNAQIATGNRNLNSLAISKNGNSIRPFANVDAVVEGNLDNISTVVLNIEDTSSVGELQSNSLIQFVEQEFFHPSPRPVEGYHLTQPWDFSLQVQTAEIANSTNVGAKTPWGIIAVHAPQAWPSARFGQGARVAVLDTGIDKDHPAVAANFEKGKDFVYDNNTPYEFADKVGHGTHCAGTIAGVQMSDGFSGVAPQAKLLSGRVCGENGCSNVAVAQGLNWAISQKVDVISMSLGGAVASAAEKRAVEQAEKAGITVVAASGNDGTPQVSYPAAFPSVIAVGAVDKTLTKAKFSQWGPELAVVAPGVEVVSSVPRGTGRDSKVSVALQGQPAKDVLSTSFQGSPEVAHALTNNLVYCGLGKPEEINNGLVAGKFAFIKRGELKFADKVKNAIAANAAGVVIFNSEPGLLQGSLTEDGSIVAIPVVMIEQTVGEELLAALNAGGSATASLVTSPSDYASFAGTSMATPHVAGVAALMRAANKNLTPAKLKSILKSTAHPLQPNDQNQTGSGVVDAELAVKEVLKN